MLRRPLEVPYLDEELDGVVVIDVTPRDVLAEFEVVARDLLAEAEELW
jgi:hypothetical protein